MKSSGQLALFAMRHCWCLCEQLQVLTASDRALIYIIGGLVINGNGVWEDPIKIRREIWSHATALCFLSPAVLAIIRILITSAFWGEIPNFGAACRQDLAEFVPKRTSVSLPDTFTILPERGSIKSGSCSTSDTKMWGYLIIYCHLKVISVSSHICEQTEVHISNVNMQTAHHGKQKGAK